MSHPNPIGRQRSSCATSAVSRSNTAYNHGHVLSEEVGNPLVAHYECYSLNKTFRLQHLSRRPSLCDPPRVPLDGEATIRPERLFSDTRHSRPFDPGDIREAADRYRQR